jgi:putative DNA methylase
MALQPFEWKDKPALIEHLFPVQKISAESYKEQMSGSGKTLTVLGSYWKGRKPLILNKACVLGALLPSSNDHLKDLEIFEMLMGMDPISMQKRLEKKLPLSKRHTVGEMMVLPYNDQVRNSKRPEELDIDLYDHIWGKVNEHLGTSASSFPELVGEIGKARYGHRPMVADVFSGSGQIPFEAARLGCDVYASDLNPIACMLTWGARHIVAANITQTESIHQEQEEIIELIQNKIDMLKIEFDGTGWKGKAYLYCNEVICPESGWKVPILPSFIVSKPRTGSHNNVCLKLIPDPEKKSYEITVVNWVDNKDLENYKKGTIQNRELIHSPDGVTIFRSSISSIRGDYKESGKNRNKLRLWEKTDFIPRPEDIFQERLYCIQWTKEKPNSSQYEYEFRAVTEDDIVREKMVIDFVSEHLDEWQEKGYVPDMVIEKGDETERLYRERGWTHWHHLFNPRQLLIAGLIRKNISFSTSFGLFRVLNWNSKLSTWNISSGGGGSIQNTFYNQALNTLFNYGCRGSKLALTQIMISSGNAQVPNNQEYKVSNQPAEEISSQSDIYITDPPYGDAVKYEEITEFFIAWLRKNPPKEFAHWIWDSRRSLAIKGEDESFRQGMIVAYRKMAEKMPDNGIQILMFTHQSGAIWGDMANIIWASGLQVTAAWYVVTESDSALRQGANVKGTVILVLRKRHQQLETFRDDLAWEIEEAVQEQVDSLIGLNEKVRSRGSDGLYTDADLQMAGYAAALKVLTAYTKIDGKDMVVESEAPKVKGEKTFVDELIDFAVHTAVQFLVPVGFEKGEWKNLQPVERFYLKMVDMEAQGANTLDNYQNFAKAFKVRHFDQLMSDSSKANSARLKISTEFEGSMTSGDAEIANTPLRALLYAFFEISKDTDIEDVLLHLMDNTPSYMQQKPVMVKMAEFLAKKRSLVKPSKAFNLSAEAGAARVLAEAMKNQRL